MSHLSGTLLSCLWNEILSVPSTLQKWYKVKNTHNNKMIDINKQKVWLYSWTGISDWVEGELGIVTVNSHLYLESIYKARSQPLSHLIPSTALLDEPIGMSLSQMISRISQMRKLRLKKVMSSEAESQYSLRVTSFPFFPASPQSQGPELCLYASKFGRQTKIMFSWTSLLSWGAVLVFSPIHSVLSPGGAW